ncbi:MULTISPECIES: TerD family protein [unclassified Paenibacillus]|uniref:TerD family protein n=1 Tax=unclassified Paenibacillus TaxID=185978 RepID=UPI00280FF490|nr:TerD family protein [Paenibacillus sp. LHD-38]MDQ8736630.1 TerD family protein [Paenibacillus sp. LHD-38]
MAISLVKGQKIDLTKGNAGLSKVIVGLGWDPAEVKGGFFGMKKAANVDCDASALLLDENGKLGGEKNLVCFYNKQNGNGSVVHTGDNITGDGDGDDEQIIVQLDQVPANIHKILCVVNIYECESRRQDFGMIKSAFIRIVNPANNQELIRFNLTENYSGKTALVVGELYRHSGEWKFSAIGEGTHAPHVDILARQYQ